MKVKETGRGLLNEAMLRLETANDALVRGNYAYSFRQSQECVELCLKACLRRIGVEYPKTHEVSIVLRDSAERFPAWFRGRIEEFCRISVGLAERRDIAMYGDEQEGLSPEKLFARGDAERAVAGATEVLRATKRLVTSSG